jgi:O-antigen biosynthesis protein WbqP
VNALRPGITGVSQVGGIDMSDPERLAASDAVYLGMISLSTDIRLILATLGVRRRGGAVRV